LHFLYNLSPVFRLAAKYHRLHFYSALLEGRTSVTFQALGWEGGLVLAIFGQLAWCEGRARGGDANLSLRYEATNIYIIIKHRNILHARGVKI
jgi:hypothetical protein